VQREAMLPRQRMRMYLTHLTSTPPYPLQHIHSSTPTPHPLLHLPHYSTYLTPHPLHPLHPNHHTHLTLAYSALPTSRSRIVPWRAIGTQSHR
jgi:hypothetical protein